MAKEFLSQKGVSYTEKDVSRDPQAASELQQLGQHGVPVILVDGHMVVGFDRAQLERLLAQATAAPGAKRPRLGASIADAAHHAPPGSPPGAYVGRVRPGSPAARAGLLPGDVIVALAGHPVDSAAAVEQILRRQGAQHPVPVRIYRNGRTHELMLDL
jgi:membrane-associated protease RseP (regulator of RpoE activity)